MLKNVMLINKECRALYPFFWMRFCVTYLVIPNYKINYKNTISKYKSKSRKIILKEMLKKRLKNELTTDYWQFQFLSYSFYSILNKDTRYKLLLYMKREHND